MKVLLAAELSELPRVIRRDNPDYSFGVLSELCDAGMIKATLHRTIRLEEQSLHGPIITLAGRAYLEQLRELSKPDQAATPTNDKPQDVGGSDKPSRSSPWADFWPKLVIGLVVAIIVWVVTRVIGG